MEVGNYWKDWKVTELVGAGSYGKVYRIKRTGLNNFVEESALKVVRIPQNASDYQSALREGMDNESVSAYFESIVNELSTEFALMSRLKGNTNIVSFEDYEVVPIPDDFGWEIFIRMEYLTPLTTYITKKDITVRDVAKIGIDICKALEVCEKENIIHRDIKPENIFVSSREDFKLGDFGIAKRLENTSVSLTKKGTLSYMAPEVYKGQPYTSSVDIYSLGIVLYKLLNYNRSPFLPPYPERIQYHHREEARAKRMSGEPLPPPVSAPADFARVILKACAYEAADRFSDAKSMRYALEALISDDEESARLYLDQLSDSDKSTVTLNDTATLTLRGENFSSGAKPAKKKLIAAGGVLGALLALIIVITAMSGNDSRSDSDVGKVVKEAQSKITETAENSVPEQTAMPQTEDIDYPDFGDNIIKVSNSEELRAAVSNHSYSSFETIEIEPGDYDDGKPLMIESSNLKLLGTGSSKPVLKFMIEVDAGNVMLENLSIDISDENATVTPQDVQDTGILCQDMSGQTVYIKDTDISLNYQTEYIIYGVTVYSPVVMSGCTIDVSHTSNGNVAVGVGDKITASGNRFISNDLGMYIFGDGADATDNDAIQQLLETNVFDAPSRISADTNY